MISQHSTEQNIEYSMEQTNTIYNNTNLKIIIPRYLPMYHNVVDFRVQKFSYNNKTHHCKTNAYFALL